MRSIDSHNLRLFAAPEQRFLRLPSTAIICMLLSILFVSGCKPSIPVGEISVDSSQAGEELPPLKYGPEDWPAWRGLTGDGKVHTQGEANKKWTSLDNVVWKIPVPGEGHACPTIVGTRIFLATADKEQQTQSVIAFDRDSGDELWQQVVLEGNFAPQNVVHNKSTHATPTIACDGERVFALFFNNDEITLTALTVQGEKLWSTVVGSYVSRFGFGSSPILYKSFVIVSSEHRGGGYLAAVHRKTGKIAWRVKRPQNDSWSTSVIYKINGKDQMILSGADAVTSYDPANGNENWQVKGTTQSTCGTAVLWDNLLFASGGYPQSETVCVEVGPSPKVKWTVREKFYVPSMLTFDGHLFGVTDKGIAYCWDAATGKEKWKARMEGGYSASPTMDGDQIFVINESGLCTLLNKNTEKLDKVVDKFFGNVAFATPTISGDRLYLRVAERIESERQEYLYCISK